MTTSQSSVKQVVKLLAISGIKFGARLGLVHNPLIPSAAKRRAENLFRQLGPNSGTVTQVWESVVFEKFWLGKYEECQSEIEHELTVGEPSLTRMDFIARLMWHGVAHHAWAISAPLQAAWEHAIEVGEWDGNPKAEWTLAQWRATQQRCGRASFNWRATSRVEALALLATQPDLCVSDRDDELSIAAIRFLLPEQWLAGHENLFHKALQPELKLWARWVDVNGDDLIRRHIRRCMRGHRWLPTRYVVTEGTREESDLPLLIYGRTWAQSASSPSVSPVHKNVLYMLNAALPWRLSGYTTRSHALLRALNSSGWTVSGAVRLSNASTFEPRAHAPAPTKGTTVDGVHYLAHEQSKVMGYPTEPYWDACRDFALTQVQDQAPALIHAASTWMVGGVARDVANASGLPMIYEVRGFPHMSTSSMRPGFGFTAKYRLHHAMEMQVANSADHVFAITSGVHAELERNGVDPEKITLLPNGINMERFVPQSRDQKLEQQLNVTGKTVIGYVGSLVEYEGLNLLLEALATLLQSHPNTVLLMVGDGPVIAPLRHQAHTLGLDHAVRFTGSVAPEEVERYYSLIDIAPFPRLGLPVCEIVSPMKPFEALGMEKAVVVSSVGALTEIVQDGVTGLVFQKDSSASLTEVLNRLLDDPDLARRLGAQGRSWVLENRTWEQHAAHVQRIYQELLDSRL